MTDSPITLSPVGIVHSPIKTPFLTSNGKGITSKRDPEKVRQHLKELDQTISRIEIDPALSGILDGIEDYSHLVILYWAHKVTRADRAITRVHPMGRKENPKVGIFSTGSPVRPNPILFTTVKLVAREENILSVTGLDAVDASPVLDIKPYVRAFYPKENTRIPDWMDRIIKAVTQ